jgi:hypothetical protein
VDEPVDHCGGDDIVAEDFAPANWNWLRFQLVDLTFDLRLFRSGAPA